MFNFESFKDFAEPIAAIGVFVLGYLLSYIEKFRGERRSQANTRSLIFTELKHNYETLSKAKSASSVDRNPWTIARGAEHTSTFIYDNYIGLVHVLSRAEVDTIFKAYTSLRSFMLMCKTFIEKYSGKEKEDEMKGIVELATAMHMFLEASLRDLKSCILTFRDGKTVIANIEAEDQETHEKTKKILDLIQADQPKQ